MQYSIQSSVTGSRSRLLTTVSIIALTVSLCGVEPSDAAAKEPTLWIDLGWQSESVHDSKNDFAIPVGSLISPTGLTGPLVEGLNLSYSYGDEGKFIFRPDGTNWVFTGSVRFGRARGKGSINQTKPIPTTSFVTFHTTIPTYPFPYHRTLTKPVKQSSQEFNAQTVTAETHFILDFEAGRDLGLGLFGRATLGAGVRFAQFSSSLNVSELHAKTGIHFAHWQYTVPTNAFFPSGVRVVPWYKSGDKQTWLSLSGSSETQREFNGIGPSVYWDASSPLFGDPKRSGEIFLDWGVNAAILFGKQKNSVEHRTSGNKNCYARRYCTGVTTQYQSNAHSLSSRRTTVPNVGGFAGVSYRIEDMEVSLGYRVDYFLRAIDTGTLGENSGKRDFRGFFASISVGVND